MQEIFDKTVAHLHAQGGPAMRPRIDPFQTNPMICAYRGEDGRKCAAGFWMPDEKYVPECENQGLRKAIRDESVLVLDLLVPEVRDTEVKIDLLIRLQAAHDGANVRASCWVFNGDEYDITEQLKEVARNFSLSSAKVNELWGRR